MNLMKKSSWYFAVLFIFIISACKNESSDPTPMITNNPQGNATRILPIGASRVEGFRPAYESYRYELWKLFIDNDNNVDLIGSLKDEFSYPTYKNLSFDTDHEGRGGATSGQILEAVTNTIDGIIEQSGMPEFVLFSTPGGNDGLENLPFDQAVKNVNAIIDLLQAKIPNVTIILEKAAPPNSNSEERIKSFLDNMNAEVTRIAMEQSNESSKVILVDMNTGFTDSLLADPVHYNEAGAKFIAQRYYDLLKDKLN
ncbi:hypothetical protein BKI52_28715 [marine bacterium AO1-C]|nr:hypothetical protein BKI52_28715 [marine bacterium AO1-C]